MKKFLLTAVFAFIGALVFAQERIAVFPFEILDNAVTRNESFQLYQVFSNEFRNRSASGSTIVPRQDVDRLINTEMDFQLTIFSAQEKTAEMMRVQNATQILSGTIGKMGNSITIIVSLYTYPALNQLPGGASMRANTAVELFDRIPELVQNMQNAIAEPVPEGLQYGITNRNAVTITGYTGNAATFNIPGSIAGLPVTVIGNEAFSSCFSLTSVTIPSSVTSIGNEAFYGCVNLTNVTIPSSVTSIGNEAFCACIRLTSVTIPPSVRSIGDSAFAGCSGLISITIPSSVMSIGEYAFLNCKSLTSITIPSSVTSIGDRTFVACSSLISVTIPSSVTSIGIQAFSGCSSLTSIIIPSSVRSIGDLAFAACSSLTSVTIPSSVTSIGGWAFRNCDSLTSVTLSRRTQVGFEAFPSSARITYRD